MFIAQLIDFYLGKRSPAPFFQKNYEIGSKYYFPNFDTLLETIAYMFTHHARITFPVFSPAIQYDPVQKVFGISHHEKVLLYSHEFWDKLLTEKYKRMDHLKPIMEFMAFQNEYLSEIIATVMV